MIKVIILILALVSIGLSQSNVGDYYWRDFNWTIPSDAFASEYNNSQVYIVQAPMRSRDMITGSLTSTSTVIFVHTNATDKFQVKTNIKILCTPDPEKFMWISNLRNKVSSNIIRVYGGFKNVDSSLYPFGNLAIGRVTTPHAVGFHNLEEEKTLRYCLEDVCHNDTEFEELYYVP